MPTTPSELSKAIEEFEIYEECRNCAKEFPIEEMVAGQCERCYRFITAAIEATHYKSKCTNEMFAGYVDAALWASTDDNGVPLDQSEAYLTDEAVERMKKDCVVFFEKARDILFALDDEIRLDWELVGHCFWLNRNGHGTGFWDREEYFGEENAEALNKISKNFGESVLYVGDDEEIHLF